MDPDSAQNTLVIILITLVHTLAIPRALAAVEALTSLHARGHTRGEATTWECPNVKHGNVALSCAMAVRRVEVVTADVVKLAKHYHTLILRNWSNACWYRDPNLAYRIIHEVVGTADCDAAKRIFDSFDERYTLLEQETIHWALAGKPRGQVGTMIVREAAIGGQEWASELYSTLNELLGWSEAEIKRAAAGAKLTYADSLKMDRIVQKKPTLVALRAVKHRWNEMDDERQRKAQAVRALTLKRIGEINGSLRERGEPLVDESRKRPKFPDTAEVKFIETNPKRRGTASYLRYEAYKDATTVKEFLEKGGKREDLWHDEKKGYCTLGGAVPTATPLLAVGAQVEVTNCQGEGQWSGIVVEVNAEARSYAITYDDDNYESDVDAGRVREDL